MLKITKLAEDLAKAKKLSQDSDEVVRLKVSEFMDSEEIVSLNRVSEDARVEYERLRGEMLKEMQKQKQKSFATDDGTKIVRSIISRLEWVDEDQVIKYLEEKNPVLIRKSIDKGKARQYVMEEIALGNKIAGVTVTEDESISITLPKND